MYLKQQQQQEQQQQAMNIHFLNVATPHLFTSPGLCSECHMLVANFSNDTIKCYIIDNKSGIWCVMYLLFTNCSLLAEHLMPVQRFKNQIVLSQGDPVLLSQSSRVYKV